MKHGLAFLGFMALFMGLAAGEAQGCGLAPARPAVYVTTSETPVAFDLNRSMHELNQLKTGTVSPYPAHYHADVGGAMSGAVAVEHRMQFHIRIDEQTGQGCVALAEIAIDINIEPKIFIASDLQNQTCLFKEIFAHETKHVEVDRALIDKYKAQFTDGLNMVLMEPADYISEMAPAAGLPSVQHRLQTDIEATLTVLFTKMMEERQGVQQEIDTLHEYERIGRACQASS
jgi:hypothetical protein